jgi:hypothetical protein
VCLCCGQQEELGLLVCGFSKDGAHILAGANDCCVYVWHWDIARRPRQKASDCSFYEPPGQQQAREAAQAQPMEVDAKPQGCAALPIPLYTSQPDDALLALLLGVYFRQPLHRCFSKEVFLVYGG